MSYSVLRKKITRPIIECFIVKTNIFLLIDGLTVLLIDGLTDV